MPNPEQILMFGQRLLSFFAHEIRSKTYPLLPEVAIAEAEPRRMILLQPIPTPAINSRNRSVISVSSPFSTLTLRMHSPPPPTFPRKVLVAEHIRYQGVGAGWVMLWVLLQEVHCMSFGSNDSEMFGEYVWCHHFAKRESCC